MLIPIKKPYLVKIAIQKNGLKLPLIYVHIQSRYVNTSLMYQYTKLNICKCAMCAVNFTCFLVRNL